MKVLTFLFLILFFYSCGFAQSVGDIVTDRPDQTESALAVPVNHLQIETGFLIENDNSDILETSNKTFNTTLLRYGLLNNLELRFGFDFQRQTINDLTNNFGEQSNNFFPLYAGIKAQLPSNTISGMDAAILAGFTNVFISDDGLSTNTKAFDAILSLASDINDLLSLGINVGGEFDVDATSFTGIYSAALGVGITSKLGGFIETYGTFQADADFDNRFDAGLTYLVQSNLQLDVSTGIGITDIAPDNFISFGVSYRMPN